MASSKKPVDDTIITEQRPRLVPTKPTAATRQAVPEPSERHVPVLPARFLEGTAWDEV
jgi:hypothetical protein